MIRPISFLAALAIALGALCCSQEQAWGAKDYHKRGYYALVIGNADYPTSPLKNPVNDAEAIARVLDKLGFHVILKRDLTRKQTIETIGDFIGVDLTQDYTIERIRELIGNAPKIKVGAFFYAGHGIQINGENFIVPVDADFNKNFLDDNVVSINQIVEFIDRKSDIGLLFLDACRATPFNSQIQETAKQGRLVAYRNIGQIGFRRGLKRVEGPKPLSPGGLQLGDGLATIDAGLDMFIAYATRPGRVAQDGVKDHSPFTEGLLHYIEEPNINIQDILTNVTKYVSNATKYSEITQVPWAASSLTEKFFFVSLTTPRPKTKRRTYPERKKTIPHVVPQPKRPSRARPFVAPP